MKRITLKIMSIAAALLLGISCFSGQAGAHPYPYHHPYHHHHGHTFINVGTVVEPYPYYAYQPAYVVEPTPVYVQPQRICAPQAVYVESEPVRMYPPSRSVFGDFFFHR